MRQKPTAFSALLKHLAKAVERLTEDEVAEVVAGRRRIVVRTEDASRSRPTTSNQPDFNSLITDLKSVETRDAAHRLLADAALTRSQLAQLAKTLDLPVQRSDDVTRLQEKIVETTIGFRLTSNAIHRKEV